MKEKKLVQRTIMTLIGIFFTALSITIFRRISWGVDPFNCLVEALEYITKLQYGIVFAVIQIVFLAVTFFLGRKYIGLGTVLSMFCIGTLVDIMTGPMNALFPDPSIVVKVILMLISMFVLCFGASLYITADLGVSSYDALSLIMSDRKITKYRYCRIITDVICVSIGFVFHANIGIATVFAAFCMGPIVSAMNDHWSSKILGVESKTS